MLNDRYGRRSLLQGVSAVAFLGSTSASFAQTPVRGGVLTVALTPDPAHLNAAIDTSIQIQMVAAKLTDGLISYNRDMEPLPQLAESWAVSPDGLRITFKLRKNVKWHDGRDFTADDVVFSAMKVWRELHPRGRSTFAPLLTVETPDPQTAIFVLSKPAPYILNALAVSESPVLPKHIYDGTDIRTNPANRAPIGTGPFRLKSWDRGSSIVLERNPNYWDGGKPYLDQLVFLIIPDASGRSAALESRQAMMSIQSQIPLGDAQRLSRLPHLAVTTDGYAFQSTMMLMEFNLDNRYLKDVRVRHAIAYAFNKSFITQNVWYGYGEDATGPIHQGMGKRFYSANVPMYPTDAAKANALLDEAGFAREKGTGVRFKLTVDPLPFGDQYLRTAEFLRQSLSPLGIAVSGHTQDYAGYIKRVYTDREFDINIFGGTASTDPTIGVQRFYWSKSFQKGVPFSNGSHYVSQPADDALEASQIELDVDKRAALFADFQRIVMTDLPVLPITAIRQVIVVDKRVRDFAVTGDGVMSNFSGAWLAA